jgi:hypothetical protein
LVIQFIIIMRMRTLTRMTTTRTRLQSHHASFEFFKLRYKIFFYLTYYNIRKKFRFVLVRHKK